MLITSFPLNLKKKATIDTVKSAWYVLNGWKRNYMIFPSFCFLSWFPW